VRLTSLILTVMRVPWRASPVKVQLSSGPVIARRLLDWKDIAQLSKEQWSTRLTLLLPFRGILGKVSSAKSVSQLTALAHAM
jgi:hypothetical protein